MKMHKKKHSAWTECTLLMNDLNPANLAISQSYFNSMRVSAGIG